MNENGAKFEDFQEAFFSQSYGGSSQPPNAFYSPEPLFVGYQPNYSPGPPNVPPNYNHPGYNAGRPFFQGPRGTAPQGFDNRSQHHPPPNMFRPHRHFPPHPGQRGRGGRGGRSWNRPNYSPRGQPNHFQQHLHHDQTSPDLREESLGAPVTDHMTEEERTYTDALGEKAGQDMMGQGRHRGGARPKHSRTHRHSNYNQQENRPSATHPNNIERSNQRRPRGGRGTGPRDFQHKNYRKTATVEESDKERNRHQETASDKDEEKENLGKHPKKIKFKEYNSSKNNETSKGSTSRGKHRNFKRLKVPDGDQDTQRGALIEQLGAAEYECMVCCDIVRQDAAVWSCSNCYHVFHLRCIKRWARSPAATIEGERVGGWRCPACQNVSQTFPHHYTCFCGKSQDPEWNRFDTPHSCGEVCGKNRGVDCSHSCNILCHPGPCPPCLASVTRSCDCGRTRQSVKCGQPAPKCEATCEAVLNCGRHECEAVCHPGGCQPCTVDVHQACYCGARERDVKCGTSESFSNYFSCEGTCKRNLDCGNHVCDRPCHPGSCDPCKLRPSAVTHCACGGRGLEELGEGGMRTSCLDPLPTCGGVCGKELACGPANKRHTCAKLCHQGGCEPCRDNVTPVVCRCAVLEKDFPCQDAIDFSPHAPFLCDKRCNRKRLCGRHRCPNVCCVEEEHPCDLACGGKLSCGLHRCEEPCHRGNCPTCWRVSFDELHCHCGAEVLYPPVACGTRPPPCAKLCRREHACDHTIRHACHSDATCPPCTELTERWCMGGHELRRNIACHLRDISCGLPCGKALPCGEHTCIKTCHKDECMAEDEVCQQLCTKPRPECSHPCGAACHPDQACPKTSCQAQIQVKCKCGNRSERALCLQGAPDSSDYQRMATMMMAMKMADVQSGQSVDISSLTGSDTKKKTRQLECTKECAILERNKRLALALEIKNPDIQGKLGNPTYSVFLKDFAKQSMNFVTSIEKQLSELVLSAQKSKQLKRSHAFPAMNSAQRRVVHELSEAYGCQSQSYDVEPNKNVVATACKDRCWQPTVTLSQFVMRELYPKAPVPIPHSLTESEMVRSSPDLPASRSTKVKMTAWNKNPPSLKPSSSDTTPTSSTPGGSSWASQVRRTTPSSGRAEKRPESEIDYFDMTE